MNNIKYDLFNCETNEIISTTYGVLPRTGDYVVLVGEDHEKSMWRVASVVHSIDTLAKSTMDIKVAIAPVAITE
jgi:hypothetical protein